MRSPSPLTLNATDEVVYCPPAVSFGRRDYAGIGPADYRFHRSFVAIDRGYGADPARAPRLPIVRFSVENGRFRFGYTIIATFPRVVRLNWRRNFHPLPIAPRPPLEGTYLVRHQSMDDLCAMLDASDADDAEREAVLASVTIEPFSHVPVSLRDRLYPRIDL